MAKFSDSQIKRFIRERKILAQGWLRKIQPRDVRSGKESSISVDGDFGSKFQLILKQNKFNKTGFCIVLGVYPPGSNKLFHLLRYDGNDHEHSNKGLPGDACKSIHYNCHIHQATERYQDAGLKEDGYAEPTTKYGTLNEALDAMIEDCNFVLPEGEITPLFGRIYGLW